MKPFRMFQVGLLMLAVAGAGIHAHTDTIAALNRIEHVYDTPPPIGPLRVLYTRDADGMETLTMTCQLFALAIPAQGLADLPRPDWARLTAPYSLVSFADGAWVDRPYVYLSIPLHGPAGSAWQQTWVIFHVDADGNLTRQIKRFIPGEHSINVVWKEWPIASGLSAESLLE